MDDNQRLAAAAAFRAICSASTQSEVARRIGMLQQTISNILKRGGLIPPENVLAAEREFGVSRHLLRPDIYPVEVDAASVEVDCDRRFGSQAGGDE